MTGMVRTRARTGWFQAAAAVVLTIGIASVVAVSSAAQTRIAGRLAVVGVATLSIALVLGSARLVGVATVPVLGGALVASAVAGEPTWVRATVLGCLWYIAAELAWDAIERRDGAQRSHGFAARRVHEVATVVALSLATAMAGFLVSSLAPVRTLFTTALLITGLVAGLILSTRHLQRFHPAPAGSDED